MRNIEDLTLKDIGVLAKQRWKTFALFPLIGAALSSASVAMTPKEFAYQATVRINVVNRGSMFHEYFDKSNRLAFDAEDVGNHFRSLLYRPTFRGKNPHLLQVMTQATPQLLVLLAYGPTLESAKTYIEKIVEETRTDYEKAIVPVIQEDQHRLQVLEASINGLRLDLQRLLQIEKALSAPSAGLADVIVHRRQLQNELTELVSKKLDFSNALLPENQYAVKILEERPVSDSPVQPKPVQTIFLGIILGLFVGTFFVIVKGLRTTTPT